MVGTDRGRPDPKPHFNRRIVFAASECGRRHPHDPVIEPHRQLKYPFRDVPEHDLRHAANTP